VRVILLVIRSVKKIFDFPERAAVSASILPDDGVLGQLLCESRVTDRRGAPPGVSGQRAKARGGEQVGVLVKAPPLSTKMAGR
jgi:hypothetical protein